MVEGGGAEYILKLHAACKASLACRDGWFWVSALLCLSAFSFPPAQASQLVIERTSPSPPSPTETNPLSYVHDLERIDTLDFCWLDPNGQVPAARSVMARDGPIAGLPVPELVRLQPPFQ